MIRKLFRDGDSRLFQVVVDSLWHLRNNPCFDTDVEEYLDEIIEKGPYECYFCDSKIGPGHYMPVTIIIIDSLEEFLMYGVCGKCTESRNVPKTLYEAIIAIPGNTML